MEDERGSHNIAWKVQAKLCLCAWPASAYQCWQHKTVPPMGTQLHHTAGPSSAWSSPHHQPQGNRLNRALGACASTGTRVKRENIKTFVQALRRMHTLLKSHTHAGSHLLTLVDQQSSVLLHHGHEVTGRRIVSARHELVQRNHAAKQRFNACAAARPCLLGPLVQSAAGKYATVMHSDECASFSHCCQAAV
jgi:hypothetical protein